MSQIAELPEEQYFRYFLNGLKEEIKHKVRLFEPLGVTRAMDLGKLIDGRNNKTERRGQFVAWGRSETMSQRGWAKQ